MESSTEQQHPMTAAPQPQHQWLHQLVGEWHYEAESLTPGKPPERATGTESVRALGDLWVQLEGRGTMPGGGEAIMQMTLGYDPGRGRFVGTWIGSMMTHLWVYDGELDESRRRLSLYAEGPSFDGQGGMARYRDAIEIRSPDERLLTSEVQGADGQWTRFMTSVFRRR